MLGATAKYPSQEHRENHELQALTEDMAPESTRNREYQHMDGEEEPLVATQDDMSDIPAKGMLYFVFS
jgi:hypothetical protein